MGTTEKTPHETALSMIWCLGSIFAGGNFSLPPFDEETADVIEASPELVAKLQRVREYQDVTKAVCRKA